MRIVGIQGNGTGKGNGCASTAEIRKTMATRKGRSVHLKVDVSLFGNGPQRVPPFRGAKTRQYGEILLPSFWCQACFRRGVFRRSDTRLSAFRRGGLTWFQNLLRHKCNPRALCDIYGLSNGQAPPTPCPKHAIRAPCATHLADVGNNLEFTGPTAEVRNTGDPNRPTCTSSNVRRSLFVACT